MRLNIAKCDRCGFQEDSKKAWTIKSLYLGGGSSYGSSDCIIGDYCPKCFKNTNEDVRKFLSTI